MQKRKKCVIIVYSFGIFREGGANMDLSEAKVIKKAQKGNKKAFEELILQHEDHIYAISIKVLKNEADAYDVAQEICLKIYQKLDQFNFESAFSTWIHRLALNTAIDEYRKLKRKREREYSYDQTTTDDGPVIKDTLHDHGETPEEHVLRQEQIKLVWEALDQLKEDQKNILILRDIEGRSYQEISDLLNISIGTVKSRIARSRVALKEIFIQITEQSTD